jgi:D-alanine-D-alanine ligase
VKKIRVGVIYGGRSGEHEVSVASAASIMKHLDRGRYEPVPIRIEKDGRWTLADKPPTSISAADVIEHTRLEAARPVRPGREAHLVAHPSEDTVLAIERRPGADIDAAATVTGVGLDVVFPVLHGPYGEDGTVQGLLELANVPYVGAGVLGSAVGMDKAVMKTLFRARDLPVGPYDRRLAARVVDVDAGSVGPGREGPALSSVRQAGQPRLQRRHLEGENSVGPHDRNGARASVRPEDRDRSGSSECPRN